MPKRKPKTAEELGPRKKPIIEHRRSGDRVIGWIEVETGKRIDEPPPAPKHAKRVEAEKPEKSKG